jgi:hypothetical protein
MADLVITATNVVPGSNAKTRTRTLGVATTAGQAMYKDAADLEKAKLADCDGVAAARVFDGIALNGGAAGQPVTLIYEGDVTIGATMTKGAAYYLSPNPGGICPVADVLTGDLPVLLGIAISTTVLRLRPISGDTVL